MTKLWDFQERALQQIREAISRGKRRICLVAPPASGKNTMAAEVMRLAIEKGGKGLFLVHLMEIISDQAERLRAHGLSVGVIQPQKPSRPFADVQVASIPTLMRRANVRPPATIVIHDEVHHVMATEYRKIIDAYPNAVLIGMTATPCRTDGRALGDLFEELVIAASYSELIEKGRIVRQRVYVPRAPIDDEEEGDVVAMDPVAAYQQFTPGLRGFIFVKRVSYGHDLAAQFCAAGIPTEVITATTKKRTRAQTIEKLKSGEIMLIVNVACLTEGVNIPDAQVCILVRKYRMVGPYLQATGRVGRAAPGKAFGVVLDLGGSSVLLGLPDEDRIYSLSGEDGAISTGSATKQCGSCGAMVSLASKVCPHCSYEFGADSELKPGVGVPTDAKVGLVEHSVSAAERLKTLDPLFRACMTSLKQTGAPILWGLQRFKADHCKDGIPRELLALISNETRKKAFDDCQGSMIRSAQWKGKLAKPGFGPSIYHDVFGTWPPKAWTDPWREEYARVEALLKGKVA